MNTHFKYIFTLTNTKQIDKTASLKDESQNAKDLNSNQTINEI